MSRIATCLCVAAFAVLALSSATPASAQSLDELLTQFQSYQMTFKGYGSETPLPSCASGVNALGGFALANVGDTLLLGLLGGALVFSRVRRDA